MDWNCNVYCHSCSETFRSASRFRHRKCVIDMTIWKGLERDISSHLGLTPARRYRHTRERLPAPSNAAVAALPHTDSSAINATSLITAPVGPMQRPNNITHSLHPDALAFQNSLVLLQNDPSLQNNSRSRSNAGHAGDGGSRPQQRVGYADDGYVYVSTQDHFPQYSGLARAVRSSDLARVKRSHKVAPLTTCPRMKEAERQDGRASAASASLELRRLLKSGWSTESTDAFVFRSGTVGFALGTVAPSFLDASSCDG